MKLTVFTLLSISVLAVSEVQAWGVLAHQAIALWAENYLLPTTVTKVQSILNDNSAAYMGNVATWADQFRSQFLNLPTNLITNHFDVGQPGEQWSAGLHFVDPPEGPPPDTCVVHEMDCPELGCLMSALANYVSSHICFIISLFLTRT
jgi:hypothetical protein